jgi:hypothetical protein
MFRGKLIGPATPPGSAARGWAAPPYGAPGPWSSSIPALDSMTLWEKIVILSLVSSNSENISYVAFLKHKNSRNRELAL